jgi:hypothetical protein
MELDGQLILWSLGNISRFPLDRRLSRPQSERQIGPQSGAKGGREATISNVREYLRPFLL